MAPLLPRTALAIAALTLTGGLAHARQMLLVANPTGFISSDNVVTEYDAVTGATISTAFVGGLSAPNGLAADGAGHLFVSTFGDNLVGEYDIHTGAAINRTFINAARQGLNGITGLALDSNNHLFVGNSNNGSFNIAGTVAEYDATTGAVVRANFDTLTLGYPSPYGIALDGKNHLLANNRAANTIVQFDATTGATTNPTLVNGQGLNAPEWFAIDGNNHLFVANALGNTIGLYNATTGATINAAFITGLSGPTGICARQ